MGLDSLYKEVILDHYRNPRNRAELADVHRHADGNNPLCGDKISLELTIDGDIVTGIAVRGQGCSISQAAGSLMSEAIKGKDLHEIARLRRLFATMMTSDQSIVDPERPGAVLGELEALAGVKAFPVRIKCASLPWATLDVALAGNAEPATTD